MTADRTVGRAARRLAWAAVLACVPERDRAPLLGDLAEEEIARHPHRAPAAPLDAWHPIAAAARVGVAYQREPYRDEHARLALAALLLGGVLLLRAVPLAAAGLGAFVDGALFSGPVWRGAAAVWRHGGLLAAAAAGLMVGRVGAVPPRAAGARWHVSAALAAIAAVTAPTGSTAVVGALLVLGATWLGASARDGAGSPPPHAPAS